MEWSGLDLKIDLAEAFSACSLFPWVHFYPVFQRRTEECYQGIGFALSAGIHQFCSTHRVTLIRRCVTRILFNRTSRVSLLSLSCSGHDARGKLKLSLFIRVVIQTAIQLDCAPYIRLESIRSFLLTSSLLLLELFWPPLT